MGKVDDRLAGDGVGVQHQQRVVVHGAEGLHAFGQRLVALVGDEGVLQGHDGGRKGEVFVVHGQVQKGDVALAVLQKFQRVGGDAVDEAEPHLRVHLVIAGDLIDEDVGKDGIRSADADGARGGGIDLFELVFRLVQLGERLFDDAEDLLAAAVGKLHAAVGAIEQRGAQLPFQLLDGLRHGGLADEQLVRRPREAPALGDRIKDSVQFEIDHGSSSLRSFVQKNIRGGRSALRAAQYTLRTAPFTGSGRAALFFFPLCGRAA